MQTCPKPVHNKTDMILCIPRVNSDVPRQKIFEVFSSLRIGFIDKISEIPLRNDETGKRIVIKFRSWVETPLSNKIKDRLDSDKDIKIVYDNPWYWVATKYIS